MKYDFSNLSFKEIEQAKQCETVEEFTAFIKENQLEVAEADIQGIFDEMKKSKAALSDEALMSVAGGYKNRFK